MRHPASHVTEGRLCVEPGTQYNSKMARCSNRISRSFYVLAQFLTITNSSFRLRLEQAWMPASLRPLMSETPPRNGFNSSSQLLQTYNSSNAERTTLRFRPGQHSMHTSTSHQALLPPLKEVSKSADQSTMMKQIPC